MKTLKNIGIIATISLALFATVTGTQVFAYSINGYVKHIQEEINQGMKTFDNQTQQISDWNQYKLELIKRAMD